MSRQPPWRSRSDTRLRGLHRLPVRITCQGLHPQAEAWETTRPVVVPTSGHPPGPARRRSIPRRVVAPGHQNQRRRHVPRLPPRGRHEPVHRVRETRAAPRRVGSSGHGRRLRRRQPLRRALRRTQRGPPPAAPHNLVPGCQHSKSPWTTSCGATSRSWPSRSTRQRARCSGGPQPQPRPAAGPACAWHAVPARRAIAGVERLHADVDGCVVGACGPAPTGRRGPAPAGWPSANRPTPMTNKMLFETGER